MMNSVFSRDVQLKSMEQTVKHAEKYLGEICSLLASYTRNTARIRDKADLLVAQLYDFSSTEDPEFQVGLKNLAEDLAMVQDYRHAQVERLETRVVAPLKAYGDIIKNKQTDLKKFSSDLKKELKELQKLENVRLRNPADRQSISQAEVNAQRASNNAQHCVGQLEETITDFQKKKLEDVKMVFMDFITVEMHFHAKALEVYTHTYHNLEGVSIQKDLELFRRRVKMSDTMPKPLDTQLRSYHSPPLASTKGQNFRSTLAFASGQNLRASQCPDPARKSRSTLQLQRGMEEKDEVKEEEEEEEEEEDEDKEEEEGRKEGRIEIENEINESDQEGQNTKGQSYAAHHVQMRRWQK